MSMGRNLWGECQETEQEEILRIANEAAKRKGYAVYADFTEIIDRAIEKAESSSLAARAVQKAQQVIRDTLIGKGWIKRTRERGEVVFYPPDSPMIPPDQTAMDI